MAEDDKANSSLSSHTTLFPWRVRRPGFWRSRAILKRLEKFRQLAIHWDRWGMYMEHAVSLEDIIGIVPEDPMVRHDRIGREMNKLAKLVAFDLEIGGVHHFVKPDETKKEQLSLVGDFQNFPFNHREKRFNSLMQRLDFAEGVYQSRKRNAVLDWFNPLWWVATVTRVPITVLEYAGLVNTVEEHSAFVTIYAWLMRGVIFILAVFLIAWLGKKLGVSIPWNVLKSAG